MNFLSRLFSRAAVATPAPMAVEQQSIAFADLSETPDPKLLPPLDRPDLDERGLSPEQRAWRRDGVVILKKFLPDSVTDPYIARRAALKNPAAGFRALLICMSRNCARCACIRR